MERVNQLQPKTDKREIKDFQKSPYATFFIRKMVLANSG